MSFPYHFYEDTSFAAGDRDINRDICDAIPELMGAGYNDQADTVNFGAGHFRIVIKNEPDDQKHPYLLDIGSYGVIPQDNPHVIKVRYFHVYSSASVNGHEVPYDCPAFLDPVNVLRGKTGVYSIYVWATAYDDAQKRRTALEFERIYSKALKEYKGVSTGLHFIFYDGFYNGAFHPAPG